MATTTLGVKLDDSVRERLKAAASKVDRTPHWLIKQALLAHLEQLERGLTLAQVFSAAPADSAAAEADTTAAPSPHQPFLDFAENVQPQSVLRAAVTSAYRRPEAEQVAMLLPQARLDVEMAANTHRLRSTCRRTCATIRPAGARASCKGCCRSSRCLRRKAWP